MKAKGDHHIVLLRCKKSVVDCVDDCHRISVRPEIWADSAAACDKARKLNHAPLLPKLMAGLGRSCPTYPLLITIIIIININIIIVVAPMQGGSGHKLT